MRADYFRKTDNNNYPYSNAKRYSVLLLDDEEDTNTVLKVGLEVQAPFNVYPYNDPDEALKSLSNAHYDIMIIDILLPKMSGFEFYQKARQLDGTSKVFFITAFENYYEEYKDKYPMWNGDCFIVKPISIASLAALLTSEIESRLEREAYN